MSKKRALDNFFTPTSEKKARKAERDVQDVQGATSNTLSSDYSNHPTYPFSVSFLPQDLADELSSGIPSTPGEAINDRPELDLLYFRPYIPSDTSRALFRFLRRSLFFQRVNYSIKRGTFETDIKTPRYTTVFGVDTSSTFSKPQSGEGPLFLAESSNPSRPVPKDRYCRCCVAPRPLPDCLDHLRRLTEIFTGAEYNFCLVNYYASGSDSISYHSDDENFLGPNPSIASLSLGGTRDFLMKHKPAIASTSGDDTNTSSTPGSNGKETPLKLPLASGDMVLMRGPTQANWLHSIPKRSGKKSHEEGGRINITFRKGVKLYCTQNYYQYNVGTGPVFKWDEQAAEMREWKPTGNHASSSS